MENTGSGATVPGGGSHEKVGPKSPNLLRRLKMRFRPGPQTTPAATISGETSSNKEIESGVIPKDEQIKPESWGGLIFDDSAELQEIGIDKHTAAKLKGIHLMDEVGIRSTLSGNVEEAAFNSTMQIITDYRMNKGLTMTLSQVEMQEVLDTISHFKDLDLSQFENTTRDIDLTNRDLVLRKLGELGYSDEVKSFISGELETYVNDRINQDKCAKAEKEGESWNVSLKEAEKGWLETVKAWVLSEKISPENRQASKDALVKITKATGREIGVAWKTIRPKTKKELAALSIRTISDFLPEAGFALSVAMGGGIAAKEIAGYGKKRVEISRIGKSIKSKDQSLTGEQKIIIEKRLRAIGLSDKRIQEFMQSGKKAARHAFYAYFANTSLGRILKEESPTNLSGRARKTALALGVATAAFSSVAAESSKFVIRIPKANQLASTALARLTLLYLGPRAAAFLASKAGGLEENQRKEWVDLASRASGTIITVSALVNSLRVTAHVGERIATQVSETTEPVSSSIMDAVSSAKERLGEINWQEAAETMEQEIVEKGVVGVVTGAREVLTHEVPHQPRTTPFEPARESVQSNVGELFSEPTASLGKTIDSDGDGVPDKIAFDTNHDGDPDSYWKINGNGEIVGGVLKDGRNLFFDENSHGIPGLHVQLAKEHPDWTPDELTQAATRAYAAGITPDNLEAISQIEKPIEVPKLGEVAEEIPIDSDDDGKPDSAWFTDKDGNIVGGIDSHGKRLIFDVRGNGTPRLQLELSNMHKDWSPDEVEVAAYRDGFLKGIDPNNQNALETIQRPIIETQEPALHIESLTRGSDFDEDRDGIKDSWWLEDPDTGKVEAGVLPDGRILYLGEEGGVTGRVQETLVNANPNLSPQEVGTTAHQSVVEHHIDNSEQVSQMLTEPKVIETVNLNVARYSFQNYFVDRFNLRPHLAHELAWNKIQLGKVNTGAIASYPPGESALGWLNPEVKIDGRLYTWNSVDWNQWLKKQGLLN